MATRQTSLEKQISNLVIIVQEPNLGPRRNNSGDARNRNNNVVSRANISYYISWSVRGILSVEHVRTSLKQDIYSTHNKSIYVCVCVGVRERENKICSVYNY
jgi:hypothetical protein